MTRNPGFTAGDRSDASEPQSTPAPAGVERGSRHAAAARHGLLVAIGATDAQEVVTAAYRPDRDNTGTSKRTVARNEGVFT